jgi:membrane associated rhomboid family serine protease
MSRFFNDIKNSFKGGNFLTRLIYINAGVFALVKVILILFTLFQIPTYWIYYLQVPAFLPSLLQQPWSILTYMFLHTNFIHAIFNLIALYYFGKLFLSYYHQKQLVAVYIWGGLAGVCTYLLGLNLIPYFVEHSLGSYLVGASASIMAILFSVVGYAPNNMVRLALIGSIKLKYIGFAFLLLDLMSLGSINSGGSLAHIGGAIMGYLYGVCYQKGTDLSKPITSIIDWLVDHCNLPKMPKRFKVKVNQTQNMSDAQWNRQQKEREKERQERIDQILEKIKKSGYQNLTDEEKKSLFQLSKKEQ